jgi:hypothetical protein
MTGEELIEYIRQDVLRDRAEPYLWSDTLILRYLNEAQNLMARKTYCLTDSTSPDIASFVTAPGLAEYDLHSSVLHVLSARIVGQTKELVDRTYARHLNKDYSSAGFPSMYVLDMSQQVMVFYPTPDDDYEVVLRVARLPQTKIDYDASPEIPEHLHIDLAEYVAYRCLINNDSDGLNMGAADRHKVDWDRRVNEAKREYYRLRMGPNAHVINNWTGRGA